MVAREERRGHTIYCPETARDILFALGHTRGLFREVVGEKNIVVGGE